MTSQNQTALRRWWARRLDHLSVRARQGQNVHISAWGNRTRPAVKTVPKKPIPSRARRRFGAGMLPAVRMPARRAVAAIFTFTSIITFAIGTVVWDTIWQAIVALRPVAVPDLHDYNYFIDKMNANHARRGLSPVSDWYNQETPRNLQPQRRAAEARPEPPPHPDGDDRIHDLRPGDEWMAPNP